MVGAKMDSMDLEREKGIMIQSARKRIVFWRHEQKQYHYWQSGHVEILPSKQNGPGVYLDGGILVLRRRLWGGSNPSRSLS
jgi:hypothetical protein